MTHSSRLNRTVLPKSWQLLSGSGLKIIALLSMLIDHIGAFILIKLPYAVEPWFVLGGEKVSLYHLSRLIGRAAFPIFCFLLVEGFQHTRSRKKYGCNLLLFALLSEIPFDLVRTGKWIDPKQNVFFTLLMGYGILCLLEMSLSLPVKTGLVAGILVSSIFFQADYGLCGVCFIVILYALREQRLFQSVACFGLLPSGWKAGLACIPLNLYNGERGFIKGAVGKYLFYVFYPVHLLVLYGLCQYLKL